MLRHQLVSEAQDLIEDPDFWTAARLTTLFNRGQRDLANAMGVAVSGYFIFESVQSQKQYQLPADWVSFDLITYLSQGTQYEIRIEPTPRHIMGTVQDPALEGLPSRAFVWAKEDRPELWINPLFDTSGTNVELFYWRRPPDMVADNDEPLIPRDWHTHLVDYAINYTMQRDNERGWSFVTFEGWWNRTKREIQMSDTLQATAHDNIRLAVYDHTLPAVGTSDTESMVNTPDNWG